MATLKVLSSGSVGNSYILEHKGQKLLIELGISWNSILKGLNFKIDDVCGAIVSHIHLDHSKSIPNALKFQLPVYSCLEVAKKYKGVRLLKHGHKYRIGLFTIQPIHVEHNVENYAYLICFDDIRMLFATDLVSFPYDIKNLDYIMMEANYSDGIAIDKLCEGINIQSHNEYHHEINSCVESLKTLNNCNLKNVMLIHLSNGQSSEEKFKEYVREAIGINPLIADCGVEMELNKEEF